MKADLQRSGTVSIHTPWRREDHRVHTSVYLWDDFKDHNEAARRVLAAFGDEPRAERLQRLAHFNDAKRTSMNDFASYALDCARHLRGA